MDNTVVTLVKFVSSVRVGTNEVPSINNENYVMDPDYTRRILSVKRKGRPLPSDALVVEVPFENILYMRRDEIKDTGERDSAPTGIKKAARHGSVNSGLAI